MGTWDKGIKRVKLAPNRMLLVFPYGRYSGEPAQIDEGRLEKTIAEWEEMRAKKDIWREV